MISRDNERYICRVHLQYFVMVWVAGRKSTRWNPLVRRSRIKLSSLDRLGIGKSGSERF